MCAKWGMRPQGAADDSIFARARGYGAATIADEFSQQGVMFQPAGKGSRKAGWQRMRTMLSQAGPGTLDSTFRGLQICLGDAPVIPRDPRDPKI